MFTLHGHRGCRGLLPENTIPAFHKAIDLGCHFLEMDVVITKDKEVLISHEPWLNHEICVAPDGKQLSVQNEKDYNLYEMTYTQIQQIDCGSIGHPRFPSQLPMRTYKPLLRDMIDNMEAYTKAKGLLPVGYNIEVKRLPKDDGLFHPDGLEFSTLIIDILREKNILDRAIVQSFDIECMQIARSICPELTLSFLVDNGKSVAANIEKLGFTPPLYGPSFQQIDQAMMDYCNANNIKVIPWTVNERADIKRLIKMGVSGLISDYPNRVIAEIANP
jgi:glycerophosphoryl diester phosphodiesterase